MPFLRSPVDFCVVVLIGGCIITSPSVLLCSALRGTSTTATSYHSCTGTTTSNSRRRQSNTVPVVTRMTTTSLESLEERSNGNQPSTKYWNVATHRFMTMLVAIPIILTTATLIQPSSATAATTMMTLDEAIVEVSETTYPILKGLDKDKFQAFSTKLGDTLLRITPDKLGTSIGLGLDVLESVPQDKLEAFNGVLKEAYADVNTDSCYLVPLPPMTIVNKFTAIAIETIDAKKVQAFETKWTPSIKALKKTEEGICLPPQRSSLNKLALAQAEIGRSFDVPTTKAFTKYVSPVLQSSITLDKALRLAEESKGVSPGASPQAKKEFAAAGKKIESVAKLEQARNKVKAQKAAVEAKKLAAQQQK